MEKSELNEAKSGGPNSGDESKTHPFTNTLMSIEDETKTNSDALRYSTRTQKLLFKVNDVFETPEAMLMTASPEFSKLWNQSLFGKLQQLQQLSMEASSDED